MAKKVFRSGLFLVLAVLSFNAGALTFSSDTITAYDRYFWMGPTEDDSILIVNPTDETVVIDSIIVGFDTSGYGEFSIAWIEVDTAKNEKRTGYYTVTDSFSASQLQQTGDIDLNRYNEGALPKKTIGAGDTIVMYSPYFSSTYSVAGIIVDCTSGNCIPPDAEQHHAHFSGRLIFVTGSRHDTLHLDCERFWWTTGITKLPAQPHAGTYATMRRSVTVDLHGRTMTDAGNCSPALFLRRERSIDNRGDAHIAIRMHLR